MKKILTVIVCFVMLYCTAYSEDKFNAIISIDYNGLFSSEKLARLNLSVDSRDSDRNGNSADVELNFCSIASQYDGKRVRISSNFIASAFSLGLRPLLKKDTSTLGYISKIILNLPCFIHILSNPSIKFTLVSFNNSRYVTDSSYSKYNSTQDMGVYLIYNVKTDYFLLNDVARIYSEGKIGLKIKYYNTALETHFVIPFTKGYFENKNPYFGVSALYYLGKRLL